MQTLVLTALLFTFAAAVPLFGDSDQFISPIKPGTPAGLVFLQGAGIRVDDYLSLVGQIQNSSSLGLYVAIPAFIDDTPEPLQVGIKISSAVSKLHSMGLPKDAPLVLAGHSLGGIMAQTHITNTSNKEHFSCLVLLGSGLVRSHRNASGKVVYPIPTLSMSGTLDGLYRVTRQAEGWFHQESDLDRFPLIVYEGVSHFQFATGSPPSFVTKHDLKPTVSMAAAQSQMAADISAFLSINLSHDPAPVARLRSSVSETGTLLAPLLKSLELEGYTYLKPPCNTDHVMDSCPFYPRYPGGHTSSTVDTDCTCGTPWSLTAQKMMAGLPNSSSAAIDVTDAIHAVSDVHPIHLPKIWSKCSDKSGVGCHLNVTTVTQQVYSELDRFDTGFYPTSASELRVKMASRQTLWEAAGFTDVNFTATDVFPSTCADINQAAWEWALGEASSAALAHFKAVGVPLVMGSDLGPYNAGPLWIYNPLKYEQAKDGSHTTVQSPMMHTPDNYPVALARGFHYCKLLSPARAMEWIYIDGLRQHGGLN